MNDVDPCTVTTEDLAAMLRVWANGLDSSEAAVERLIGHRSWLRRADFHRACVEVVEVAEQLDELAGVWINELLGLLAREMSVRLYDRIGV